MSRLHVHISVDDLEQNIRFYSALFGTAPSICKDDYAKWDLEDPAVNFAISRRGAQTGLDHAGIQAETAG
jgi:predicted enzyme related to lactoylglutathione lyase